jgi:hypothetical protein
MNLEHHRRPPHVRGTLSESSNVCCGVIRSWLRPIAPRSTSVLPYGAAKSKHRKQKTQYVTLIWLLNWRRCSRHSLLGRTSASQRIYSRHPVGGRSRRGTFCEIACTWSCERWEARHQASMFFVASMLHGSARTVAPGTWKSTGSVMRTRTSQTDTRDSCVRTLSSDRITPSNLAWDSV